MEGYAKPFTPREPRLSESDDAGRVSVDDLNAEFDQTYLEDDRNPRWVAKPTVAYLWARTAECGGCRARIPLLKTRWLCKKRTPLKRVLLTMTTDSMVRDIELGVQSEIPSLDGTAAEKRLYDQELGAGTMSRTGATCPRCGTTTTMKELRAQGRLGKLGARMTAVVVKGQQGKEYRSPTAFDLAAANVDPDMIEEIYRDIPFGRPNEPTPSKDVLGMRVPLYGLDAWDTLFTDRQLFSLGIVIQETRRLQALLKREYPPEWSEALASYLAAALSKLIYNSSSLCSWRSGSEGIRGTFARYALSMVWDFAEANPIDVFEKVTKAITQSLEPVLFASPPAEFAPSVTIRSALAAQPKNLDLICTDPPYYDAIPYSDLMDFFYVWLRRALSGLSSEADAAFAEPIGPKWSIADADGELIDEAERFGGSKSQSKENYENGMARAMVRCYDALRDNGRLVLVFANKNPAAWETLVSAIVQSGFTVTGSWPIQTEMPTRNRARGSAALASSIWLVCRKRPLSSLPGWESDVLHKMGIAVTERLRAFWDAGIRGPDFVWSATGPALETFSQHPVVKRIRGRPMHVREFLAAARRIVIGFIVSQLLGKSVADDLDEPTTYYLLHRNDFGLGDAPSGAVILYALSCHLKDADLTRHYDLLTRSGGRTTDSAFQLKRWSQRRTYKAGENAFGTSIPFIDSLHQSMRLWRQGDLNEVNRFMDGRGLRTSETFAQVTQSVLEMADPNVDKTRGAAVHLREERAILEALQNHLGRGRRVEPSQTRLL